MSLQESTSRGTYAQGDLIIKVTSGSFALQIWRCLNETRRHLANFEGSFTEMIFSIIVVYVNDFGLSNWKTLKIQGLLVPYQSLPQIMLRRGSLAFTTVQIRFPLSWRIEILRMERGRIICKTGRVLLGCTRIVKSLQFPSISVRFKQKCLLLIGKFLFRCKGCQDLHSQLEMGNF